MRKKKTVTNTLLAVSAVFLCSGGLCWAISITTTGSWSQTIDASNLTGGAGSNLNDTYQSDPAAVSITITATSGNWALTVKKIDSKWHGNLHLWVKRTSEGEPSGNISGGTSYQEVGDTDLAFFNGTGDKSNVTIRLQLTGVSIQVPPDSYMTAVYYTVSDL
jgi:hypothetical protein